MDDSWDLYLVTLRLDTSATITVGALGEVDFDAGYYVYVGSAKRGIDARLRRHRRLDDKRLHWHIDYLRAESEWIGAHVVETKGECELAEVVATMTGAGRVHPAFGASDCGCDGHLIFFDAEPSGLPGRAWPVDDSWM